jgi:alpha-amylase
MKKINLIFGLHNHQPVGNFDFVFEDAYEKSYRPFLDVLDKHPGIRVVIHNTGILFEWLADNKPEYIERLKGLIADNRLEIMTGGYYEPILPIIPDADKIGQIQKLTQFIKDKTGYDATGMWLAERVWEPQLARHMARAGVKYTVLDDSHFRSTGIPESQTHGYFFTEDEGELLAAFPISEKLRYTIPFMDPQATIDYLREVSTEDGLSTVVMADDGEKFGVWPDTYRHCYEAGWLDNFFSILEQNSDWINVTTFSDVLGETPPLGRTYLPTASYFEMMEWTMPPKAILQYESFVDDLKEAAKYEDNKVFVRSGFWRNFFTKYDESNQMHKRMLQVSRRLAKLDGKLTEDQRAKISDGLWAGQCNCGYWHGVFGGLYLGHLRDGLYRNLIEADHVLDQAEHGDKPFVSCYEEDMLADMTPEVIAENAQQKLIFKPNQGGQLLEHDWKTNGFNFTNMLTRRFEAYHKKVAEAAGPDEAAAASEGKSIHDIVLAKEANLQQYLTYDWYRRNSLVDHFLGDASNIENFRTAQFAEDGDFVNQAYEIETISDDDKKAVVKLTRNGHVHQPDGVRTVTLEKTISFGQDETGFKASYKISNTSRQKLKTRFAVEVATNFLAGDAPDRYYVGVDGSAENNKLNSLGVQKNVREVGFVDEWVNAKYAIQFADEVGEVWRAPIETVSLSESGFERVFQGSVLMPVIPLELDAGASVTFEFEVVVTHYK